jgi:muramoyltetrapeptide carboxypeptidase LdcA involved in peptidoglycan recycling
MFWVDHRAWRRTGYLESLGLVVREMPHSGAAMSGQEVTAQQRAEDIHAAFADPAVSVVLCAVGGDNSRELLPHLDFDLIRVVRFSSAGVRARDVLDG